MISRFKVLFFEINELIFNIFFEAMFVLGVHSFTVQLFGDELVWICCH
jgi:hypothetical protein